MATKLATKSETDATPAPSTEVTQVQDSQIANLATLSDEDMSFMEGVENSGISDNLEDRGTPLLYIAQKGSKQVNKREADYIPGLEVGMAFNNLTNRFWDAESEGVPLIPCFFRSVWNEWTPIEQGGGYHGSHPRDVDWEAMGGSLRGAGGKDERRDIVDLPNGHELIMTHEYFCLFADTLSPIVVPMASSNLWGSSRLQALMSDQRGINNGRLVTLPAFFNVYNFKTMYKVNEKGDWFRWAPQLVGPTSSLQRKAGRSLALMAKAGEVKVAQPMSDGEAMGTVIEEGKELPI